jgi:hypothetical protein
MTRDLWVLDCATLCADVEEQVDHHIRDNWSIIIYEAVSEMSASWKEAKKKLRKAQTKIFYAYEIKKTVGFWTKGIEKRGGYLWK